MKVGFGTNSDKGNAHDNHNVAQLKKLGYWMSEKKSRKFNQTAFPTVCRYAGLELVQIDLTRSLEEQGPFAAILHKLTDVIVKAEAMGDSEEEGVIQYKKIISSLEEYIVSHPAMVVIDPICNVRTLLDRSKTYHLIEESSLVREGGVFTPTFVELTTTNVKDNLAAIRKGGVTFPLVCKPSIAHGSKLAHQMAIIFNDDGVKDVTPPCVAQEFICHNAVLYKLFAIGDKWYQVERPSLKNFYAGDQKTIFFDSHDVSKANAASSLNKLDEEDVGKPLPVPLQDTFHKIVGTIHKNLGMALFGVDVVIENVTGKYAIIDINAFPGYDGVPDFHDLLISFIVQELQRKESSSKPMNSEATITSEEQSLIDSSQDDSGIDTGDSSDEKKNKKPTKVTRRQYCRTVSLHAQAYSS